jgi:NAD(P)H-dependent flavin oxidoreductase YrpB (nitropropane dioxygenase family)
MRTPICEKLGIEFPIFAFSHCRDVVAAVSKAGGFGVLGAVAFTPEQLEMELNWIDANINGKPYGVDIVIPAKYVGRQDGDIDKASLSDMIPTEHREWIDGLLEKHHVPKLSDSVEENESLLGWSASGGRAAVEVAMKHPIRLIANALGPPPADIIEEAHKKDILVAALVGSVKHARKQKEAGVDIIVASGYEAGGHTGEITSMLLWPQVVDAVGPDTPVLAAGGIGSGRHIAAGLSLGCQGVWTGSIWLTAAESDYQPALVDKLLDADSSQTVRSRCISGKPARMLVTPYTEAWDGEGSPGTLPMPLQYMATAEATQRIYKHAESGGSEAATLLGTPVGQVVGMMNARRPAKNIVADWVNEYVETVSGLAHQLEEAASEG